MIQFTCLCGRKLQVPKEHVGKQVKCPACGQVSTVPESEAIVVAEEAAARPERGRAEAVQPERRERDRRPEMEDQERPRRRVSRQPDRTSGKATASLILGLLACPCLIGNVLTGLPAVILGILALKDISASEGRLGGKGLALTGLITGLVGMVLLLPAVLLGMLFPAVGKVREAAVRAQEQNNLKQITLAMHNCNSAVGALPQPTAYRSADGKPLLSWRVALLPYIEEDFLYKDFKLDEPWDSPHNIKLLPRIPRTYQRPEEKNPGAGLTHYQVLVGPDAFEDLPTGRPGLQLGLRIPGSFPDGLSNTILVVVAEQGVPWTKPEDLKYDPNGPLPRLHKRPSGYIVGVGDGSVRTLRPSISERTLRNAITRSDGNVLGSDW
jgi:hypothetical protein